MNKEQIQQIYQRQMDYYLQLIVDLGLAKDILDFNYLNKTRFVFVFKLRPALNVFLLKVLVSANNDSKVLPVDFEIHNNILCLTTTEING